MLKDLEKEFETCISALLPGFTRKGATSTEIKDAAIAVGILTEKLMLLRRG